MKWTGVADPLALKPHSRIERRLVRPRWVSHRGRLRGRQRRRRRRLAPAAALLARLVPRLRAGAFARFAARSARRCAKWDSPVSRRDTPAFVTTHLSLSSRHTCLSSRHTCLSLRDTPLRRRGIQFYWPGAIARCRCELKAQLLRITLIASGAFGGCDRSRGVGDGGGARGFVLCSVVFLCY